MSTRSGFGARAANLGLAIASAATLLSGAASAATTQRADGVMVKTGAEWVSAPITPSTLTVDMQRLPPAPEWKPGDPIVEIPRQFYGDPNAPVPPVEYQGSDPLAQKQRDFVPTRGGFNAPVQNFNVLAGTAQPNDPTGDIGTLQFVAAINGPGGGQFAVYNKVTGAQVVAPTLMESLGTGGSCAAGLGDPIVLFDELASRWVLTEFSSSGNNLCVYISNTADLSGTVTWVRYGFTLPSFPDYPKYAVWPDAYYVGANESGTAGQRPLYAMDRVAMLAGNPATLQRLTTPSLGGFGFQMIQPADITGTTPPPAGAAAIFMRHRDDEAHPPATAQDFLQLYEFRVNWVTPASSSITGPINIAVTEFSSNLNGLSAFNAFPQPSGQKLDPLRETVMHRLTYRNFGSYEALVGNLVTDLNISGYPDDTGGIRWFELRRGGGGGPVDLMFSNGFENTVLAPTGGINWALYQEGTFAPSDGALADQADRWMAASSIDEAGNIGMAYNVVRQAPAISASIRFTGRLESDPLGVMTQGDNEAILGGGSTTGERWGDYADMGVDPVDGCTFWFIGNYLTAGVRSNRAVAFRHDACGTPTFTISAAPPSVLVCANLAAPTNAPPITVNIGSVASYNVPVNLTFPNPFPTGVTGTTIPSTVAVLPGSSTLQLTANNTATPGANLVLVRGTSGAIVKDTTVTLNVATAAPGTVNLTAPANAAIGISTRPTFTWAAVAQASSYVVEASTSNTFGTLLFTQTVTGTSLPSPIQLPPNTQIFWRVRPTNQCGNGPNSVVFSFTTVAEFCSSPNAPIPEFIAGGTGVNDDLVVAASQILTDLDVQVQITHTYPGDLDVTLTRVGGPSVVVGVRLGGTGCATDNVDVIFTDEGGTPIACATLPPGVAGLRTSANPLTPFDGASFAATWRLNVIDRANLDVGTLNRWCLIPTP